MTVGELKELLEDFGDHIPVVAVRLDGNHQEIESLDTATTDGTAAAGIVLGNVIL